MSQPAAADPLSIAQTSADLAAEDASAPLMLSQLIDRLSPPPTPMPISWWPQTWGWLVLGLIVGALMLWVGWRRYRLWKANRYRREALAELHRRLTAGEGCVAVAEVLRRTALVAFPRQEVAALRGEPWGHFLNRTLAPGEPCFDPESTELLAELPYRERRVGNHQLDDLTRRVERWITRHEAAKSAKSAKGAAHD